MGNEKDIDALLEEDNYVGINNEDKSNITQCWNGAIAYHFYILLQRQIHDDALSINSLFICRILCKFYDHILNEMDIYSLYALVSYKCQYFQDCSNAMTRLQFLSSHNKKHNKLYKKLAINIFTKHDPINPCNKTTTKQCKNVNDKDLNIHNICMASARYIENAHIDTESFVVCTVCKHKTLKQYLNEYDFCPLCHSPF